MLQLIITLGFASILSISGLSLLHSYRDRELLRFSRDLKVYLDHASQLSLLHRTTVTVRVNTSDAHFAHDRPSSELVTQLLEAPSADSNPIVVQKGRALFANTLPIPDSIDLTMRFGTIRVEDKIKGPAIYFYPNATSSPGRVILEDQTGNRCEVILSLHGTRRRECA